jgi:hypothetical protein
MYRTAGSIAITAAARASFILGPEPDNPDGFIFACTKLNGARKPRSIRYRVVEQVLKGNIETQRVQWFGETDATADDVVQDPDAAPRGPKPEKSELADLIIKTELADGLWHASKPIIDFGKERGVSYDTVIDVTKALGVEKKKVGFKPARWYWRLPKPTSPETPNNSPSSMNLYGENGFAEHGVQHADSELSPTSTNPNGENDFVEDGEFPHNTNSPSSVKSFSTNAFNNSGEAENHENGEFLGFPGTAGEKSDSDPSADGVPFVITEAMRANLRSRGFRDKDIARMTPEEAHDYIREDVGVFRPDDVDDDEQPR